MYAQISDGIVTKYPVYPGEIMSQFPETSFPVPFEPPDGFVKVKQTEAPATNYLQNLVEATPVFSDGVLVQQWIVEDASEEEIAQRTADRATQVRNTRNAKLSESDWTQLSDSTADKQAWAQYRQELRDITAQAEFPWTVSWPQEP